MQQERNRVVEGMQEWKAREQTIADLFSASAIRSRYAQQLKLDHLRELRNKLKGEDLTKDERAVLRILRGEIRSIEKGLYPSRLIRYAVRLGRMVKGMLKPGTKTSEPFPDWKLKMPKPHMDDPGNKNRATLKVQQKATMRPTIVQKTRNSQRKGLKIK